VQIEREALHSAFPPIDRDNQSPGSRSTSERPHIALGFPSSMYLMYLEI
jgi:hypothetical protein